VLDRWEQQIEHLKQAAAAARRQEPGAQRGLV